MNTSGSTPDNDTFGIYDNSSALGNTSRPEEYVIYPNYEYYYYYAAYDLNTPAYIMNMNFGQFLKLAYPIIVALSVIGNSLVLLVVLQKKNRKFSSSIFIGSLAVADMFISGNDLNNWLSHIMQIKAAYSTWDCRLRNILPGTGNYGSPWSLIAVATERAVSVLYPHKVRNIFTLRSSIVIVCIIWICSFGLSIWQSMRAVYSEEIVSGEKVGYCVTDIRVTKLETDITNYIHVILSFFIPYIVILTSTIIITRSMVSSNVRKMSGQTMRQTVTVTLLQVNILFLLTAGPRTVFIIMDEFFDFFGIYSNVSFTFDFYKILMVRMLASNVSIFLLNLNSVFNVFVYMLNSSKFRQDILNIFRLHENATKGKKVLSKMKSDSSFVASQKSSRGPNSFLA